jgi:RNA polymerase subunit RPABC4/transcription elongation factor Spt4
MFDLADCPSCGGLLPEERGCCPHCHCRYSGVRRWRLLIAAAIGVASAACYGPPPTMRDVGTPKATPREGAAKDGGTSQNPP